MFSDFFPSSLQLAIVVTQCNLILIVCCFRISCGNDRKDIKTASRFLFHIIRIIQKLKTSNQRKQENDMQTHRKDTKQV